MHLPGAAASKSVHPALKSSVSEIKYFSDAHIGCMNPRTMHPAKYLCTFPYMIILNVKKGMHFRVHGAKNPCTRGSNHAPRVQGAPLISDTESCTQGAGCTLNFEHCHCMKEAISNQTYL